MKVVALVLLVGLVSSTDVIEFNDIGQNCGKNPTFNITGFDINPWPIYAAQEYVITMSGVFTAAEYVEQVYIGTRKDLELWHYAYVDVKAQFQKGASKTFTLSEEGPSFKGSYLSQVTLHRHDFSILSCWQYSYSIRN